MERKQITAFLSEQLIQDKLTGNGKYWAREVCLDWGTKDVRRVDFMEFCPTGVLSVSEIEKGIFVSYEVKSCMADYKSGFGQNFVTEKNYLVMPAEVYKKILQERPSGIGVICPIPLGKGLTDEFENPTWTIVNKKDTIFKYIFWEWLDSLPIPESCFHFVWCQIA